MEARGAVSKMLPRIDTMHMANSIHIDTGATKKMIKQMVFVCIKTVNMMFN